MEFHVSLSQILYCPYTIVSFRKLKAVDNMYNNGVLCLFLDQGFGSCSLNGSRCDCPFGKTGCEIQCERIFKEKPEGEIANRYKATASGTKPLTKSDIFKRVGIQKGMLIADWFIPYSYIDEVACSPSDVIDHGIDMVKRKLGVAEYHHYSPMRMYHNVEMAGQLGIYIIGIC